MLGYHTWFGRVITLDITVDLTSEDVRFNKSQGRLREAPFCTRDVAAICDFGSLTPQLPRCDEIGYGGSSLT